MTFQIFLISDYLLINFWLRFLPKFILFYAISLSRFPRRAGDARPAHHHPFILFPPLQTGLFYQRPLPKRGERRDFQPTKTAEFARPSDALFGGRGDGFGVRAAVFAASDGGEKR